MKEIKSGIRGAICYKGRHGATRQYAEWIAEETGFPLFDLRRVQPRLEEFDLLILGSGVYIGRYFLTNWLNDYWPEILDKHRVLFTVSGTAPDHPDIRKYFKNNLTPDMQERMEYFPLRGKLKLKEAGFWLRLFLKFASRVEKDSDGRRRMKEGFDYVKRENIQPVVEAARELPMVFEPLEV